MSETPAGRLRARPQERFAGLEHLLDLREALAQLRHELHPSVHGHRQQTVYHHAQTTVILFDFDTGGQLADHTAAGTVLIQALEGGLAVRTDEHAYELAPGMLLALAPGVRHSVSAPQAGVMLLTVCRDPASATADLADAQ